jgi:hypothetical protein
MAAQAIRSVQGGRSSTVSLAGKGAQNFGADPGVATRWAHKPFAKDFAWRPFAFACLGCVLWPWVAGLTGLVFPSYYAYCYWVTSWCQYVVRFKALPCGQLLGC